MVLDSKLPEHLAHFGIDMMTMEKARSGFPTFHVTVVCCFFKPPPLIFKSIFLCKRRLSEP